MRATLLDAKHVRERPVLRFPFASEVPGVMHACGHDGHTAMLLAAAQYLAATRAFAGQAVLIFQPGEEAGGGARAMIAEGFLARYPLDEVYALHNMPGLSGLDIARELAANHPDLAVVISSGYVSDELLAAAAQAGVRRVMQKEYTLEQLPDLIRDVLAEPAPA